MIDHVPAGADFVSVVTDRGTCTPVGSPSVETVECALGTLVEGEVAHVTLKLKATLLAGRLVNLATVFSVTNNDDVTNNNRATANTLITCGGEITVTGGPIGAAAVNGLQPGRLFRNGSPSLCGFPKPFPGYSSPTDRVNRRFDLYSFTNDGNVTECITVEVTAGASCASNLLYAVAYLGSYNPANLAENFLADLGSSPSPAVGVPTLSFSFEVPAGATFKLVIHEVNPPPTSCGAYSFRVFGLPQACPAPSLAARGALDLVPFSTKPAQPAAVPYSSVPQR
jgi:hypothetical protein